MPRGTWSPEAFALSFGELDVGWPGIGMLTWASVR